MDLVTIFFLLIIGVTYVDSPKALWKCDFLVLCLLFPSDWICVMYVSIWHNLLVFIVAFFLVLYSSLGDLSHSFFLFILLLSSISSSTTTWQVQACSKVSTDESDFGSTLSSTGSSGINIFSPCNFHYRIVLIEVHYCILFSLLNGWLIWYHSMKNGWLIYNCGLIFFFFFYLFSGICFDVLYNLNLSRI